MPPVLGTGRASLETHGASSLSASQGLGHSRFRLSGCSSTPIKAPRVLSLGDTAQSAETVGNRLSFVDKIPSQAPAMHEPEDDVAEYEDDDAEGLQPEASARRSRVRGSKEPSD